MVRKGGVLILVLLLWKSLTSADPSPIKADETVIFFPSVAYRGEKQATWTIRVHGWLFEPQRLVDRPLRFVQQLLGQEFAAAHSTDQPLLSQRLRLFLVDNERRKAIPIQVGGERFVLPASGANGHFQGAVPIAPAALTQLRHGQQLIAFAAIPSAGDTRQFAGTAYVLDPQGVSVISDIDDTIKVSEVRDRRALLANTFVRPYQAVSGMVPVYQRWASQGALFHYVSGSPWQLYPPLAEFLAEHGYPQGSFHLRPFRLTDGSLLQFLGSVQPHKRQAITELLRCCPQRQYILVGDSGEADPEIYAEMARKYPRQVQRIFIRDVTGEGAQAARYKKTFAGVPASVWTIFQEPHEIQAALP